MHKKFLMRVVALMIYILMRGWMRNSLEHKKNRWGYYIKLFEIDTFTMKTSVRLTWWELKVNISNNCTIITHWTKTCALKICNLTYWSQQKILVDNRDVFQVFDMPCGKVPPTKIKYIYGISGWIVEVYDWYN